MPRGPYGPTTYANTDTHGHAGRYDHGDANSHTDLRTNRDTVLQQPLHPLPDRPTRLLRGIFVWLLYSESQLRLQRSLCAEQRSLPLHLRLLLVCDRDANTDADTNDNNNSHFSTM